MLAAMGLSGTPANATTSGAACLFMLAWRRRTIRTITPHWLLIALGIAAGVTSIGFTWGAIHGQVMRVLLLFYLTPAWMGRCSRISSCAIGSRARTPRCRSSCSRARSHDALVAEARPAAAR